MAYHNPLGYSVLSPAMTRAAFGDEAVEGYEPDLSQINYIFDDMEKFGVEFPIKNPEVFENLSEFYLPELKGKNIAEHFDNISNSILSEKVKLLKSFADCDIPEPPSFESIVYVPGWVRYEWEEGDTWNTTVMGKDGMANVPIAVFDCETFVKGSNFGHPILATAVSSDSYWVWMHESFVDPNVPYVPQLVPTGTTNTI